MKIPSFPIGSLLERWANLTSSPSELPSSTTRLVRLYNQSTAIANSTLLMTAVGGIAVAASYFQPSDGIIALSTIWIHWSAREYCAQIISENSDPTTLNPLYLDPYRTKDWVKTVYLMHPRLPEVTLEDLEALPFCITESLKLLTSPKLVEFQSPAKRHSIQVKSQEIEQIWHRVHERNRAYLRMFFALSGEEMAEIGRAENLLRLYSAYLEGVPSELFLSEPRKRAEIRAFINSMSGKKTLKPVPEES